VSVGQVTGPMVLVRFAKLLAFKDSTNLNSPIVRRVIASRYASARIIEPISEDATRG
jgi:hypothetical protein